MNKQELIKSDVTIVGGGLAGMSAAISAARQGLKVALINDRPVLGGNASSEIGVGINGSASGGKSKSVYGRETGIIEEMKLNLIHYSGGQISRAVKDSVFLDLIYKETKINLYLNTVIFDVEEKDKEVKAVIGVQFNSERHFRFESPIFIDSSGDGVVGAKANALYMWGREGKDDFNEIYAPDKGDNYTLGDTIIFRSKDIGRKIGYKKPDFAYDITKQPFFKNLNRLHRPIRMGGFWWVEYGGQVNTITDNEDIVLELRKIVYGIWDYMKNSGLYENLDTHILDYLSPIPGKRESRRFIGDYILTQNDIENKTEFFDAVTIGGWPMDVHAPKGIYDEGPATHWYTVFGMYNIPFRCLYSKNIKNLMFAGRNISATHVAFGSTRVMATGASMGQAVGMAAYLCKKYGINPNEITENHISELQDILLKEDQTIIGKEEKMNDELISDCKITSSSTKAYENVNIAGRLDLTEEYCLALPIKTKMLDSVDVKVKNKNDKSETLTFDVYTGDRKENYIPTKHLKTIHVKIESKCDHYVSLPISSEVGNDQKIYLIFKPNENLSLYYCDDKLTGAVSFKEFKHDYHTSHIEYINIKTLKENVAFKNVLPKQDIYSVQNVLNEYSRPYGLPNIWISETIKGNKKAFIDITYDKPKKVNEIHLVFNTMLEVELPKQGIKELVKDYKIIIIDSKGNEKIITIKNNYLRLNKHPIHVDDVIQIKIEFESNYGGPYYELFSIKLV